MASHAPSLGTTGHEWQRRIHPNVKCMLRRYLHLSATDPVLTVRHRIDETSPLLGMTQEVLHHEDIRIIASIVGVDTVIVAPVQSFGDYNYEQIQWNRRFVEIYN
jgi:hypothetical protein